MEDERVPQKGSLMENFIIKGQWQSQKQGGRTSSGGTHHSRNTR